MERLRGTCISIHASAREATEIKSCKADVYSGFQSTPPRGRRLVSPDVRDRELQFQSTPPRGRRQVKDDDSKQIFDFNPRLREGGDSGDGIYYYPIEDFNPRLREGGDFFCCLLFLPSLPISIHASAREATSVTLAVSQRYLFQSTPPRGRRRCATRKR